jgi:serine/threonine protein kinase
MPDKPEDLILGAYRVLRREDGSHWILGRGGYGTTYKAEHIHLERVCALKVINDNLVRDEQAAQRFLQEARIAASLDHVNIARIYDFGRCDGVFYYAMSFCSGGDLEQFSATNGPQPWSVVKELALQILGALETAHHKGLLHRDLKPSNIMLAQNDGSVDLRLIDFGLVKALDNGSAETNLAQTREGTFMGNPLTASPEQFRVEPLDERSDLYSLGVTLWCLLNGGAPFRGVSVAEIAHQRLSSEGHLHQLPPDLDPGAKYVLGKLLATNKEDRFRNVEETREAIVNGTIGPIEIPDDGKGSPEDGAKDWKQSWEIGARLAHFNYGSYYSCTGKSFSRSHATLFVPDQESPNLESIKGEARKLLGSHDQILINFSQEGVLEGVDCFLCAPFPPGNFQYLLQATGPLNLPNNLSFFQQIASAVDDASARGIPGIELEDHEIMLGVSRDDPHALVTPDDWVHYFKTDASSARGPTAGLRAMVLPKLLAPADADSAPATTISGDDLAPNPIRRFAGFLYHAFSGRLVNPGAYLSSTAYVASSNISENSNRYLKEVMSGSEIPASALDLLHELSRCESCHWSTRQWEDDLTIKVSTYPRQADTPSVIPGPPTAESAWHSAGNSAVSGALEATRIISHPLPPVPDSQEQSGHQGESGRKRVKLIAAVAAAVLALAVVGVMLRSGNGDKAGGGVPAAVEKGSLQFSEIALTGTLPPSGLQLQDKEGIVLGEFTMKGTTAVVGDFPLKVFDEPARWPLAIKLRADEKTYIMPSVELKETQFANESGDSRSFEGPLELDIRTYLEIEPVVTLDNTTLDIPASLLSNELRPTKSGLRWALTNDGKKLGIALPAGEDFPVDATLSLALTTPLTLTLGPKAGSRWNLEIPKRKLRLLGIPPVANLVFEPDFSTVRDQSYQKALAQAITRSTISSRDFNLAGKQWELPKVNGVLVAALADGTGEFRLEIGLNTKIKLVFDGSDREPGEPEKVVKEREQAERGDTDSQLRLAFDYLEMNAVGRSLEWFRFAAAEGEGDPRAQVALGTIYLTGSGVQVNENEAVKWFEKAIANGDDSGKAHNNLGVCYERGTGVDLDLNKAKEHFEKAIEQGWIEAMVSLGILLTNKDSPVADPPRGVQLFQDAVKLKSVPAIRELGYCYWIGIGPIEHDKEMAKKLWKEAAAKGDTTAQQMLKNAGE